jgi:hypothetical protein
MVAHSTSRTPKEIELNNVLQGLCLTFSVVADIYLVRAGAAVVSTLCEEPVVEVVCAQKPRKRRIHVLRTERSQCIMLQRNLG